VAAKNTVHVSWFRVILIWWVAGLFWLGFSNAHLQAAYHAVALAHLRVDAGLIHWTNSVTGTPIIGPWLAGTLEPVGHWAEADGQHWAAARATKVYALTFGDKSGQISAQAVLLALLWAWSVPVMGLLALWGSVAALATGWVVRHEVLSPGASSRKGDTWDCVDISIGALQRPHWLRSARTGLRFTLPKDLHDKIAGYVKKYPDHARALEAVLALLQDSDAHAGPGHFPLFEHSIGVLRMAWETDTLHDPLVPLVAASHDLGKIITHQHGNTANNDQGYHDTLGARILASLHQVQALPPADRDILLLIVGYAHKAAERPYPRGRVSELERRAAKGKDEAMALSKAQAADAAINQARLEAVYQATTGADKVTTQAEKEALRAAPDFRNDLFRAFVDMLRDTKNFPWNQKTNTAEAAVFPYVGESDRFLLILDTRLRDYIDTKFPTDLKAIAGSGLRNPAHVSEQTWTLMAVLREKGWLVEELFGVRSSFFLWDLTRGTGFRGTEFNGVFAVRPPDPQWHALTQAHDLKQMFRIYRVLPTKVTGAYAPAVYKEFGSEMAADERVPMGAQPGIDPETGKTPKEMALPGKSVAPADAATAPLPEPRLSAAAATTALNAGGSAPPASAELPAQDALASLDGGSIDPVPGVPAPDQPTEHGVADGAVQQALGGREPELGVARETLNADSRGGKPVPALRQRESAIQTRTGPAKHESAAPVAAPPTDRIAVTKAQVRAASKAQPDLPPDSPVRFGANAMGAPVPRHQAASPPVSPPSGSGQIFGKLNKADGAIRQPGVGKVSAALIAPTDG
jgi:hypothetical protein